MPKGQICMTCVTFADEIGVALDMEADPQDGWMWDGYRIAGKGLACQNITHEIAHWLVSSPEQRRYPDFGLGAGPESGKSYRRLSDGYRDRAETTARESDPYDIQESVASFLGIAIEAALDHQSWQTTLTEHTWLEHESTDPVREDKVRIGYLRSRYPDGVECRVHTLSVYESNVRSLRDELRRWFAPNGDMVHPTCRRLRPPRLWRRLWRDMQSLLDKMSVKRGKERVPHRKAVQSI